VVPNGLERPAEGGTLLSPEREARTMRVLAAVDTVHTAAALCDYLGDRLDEGDEVIAVTVHPPADAGPKASADAVRDRQEALNVASVRLAVPDVETVEREGEIPSQLLEAAGDHDVDELVLGARAGTPGTPSGVGEIAQAVLSGAALPVVVVPIGDG